MLLVPLVFQKPDSFKQNLPISPRTLETYWPLDLPAKQNKIDQSVPQIKKKQIYFFDKFGILILIRFGVNWPKVHRCGAIWKTHWIANTQRSFLLHAFSLPCLSSRLTFSWLPLFWPSSSLPWKLTLTLHLNASARMKAILINFSVHFLFFLNRSLHSTSLFRQSAKTSHVLMLCQFLIRCCVVSSINPFLLDSLSHNLLNIKHQ